MRPHAMPPGHVGTGELAIRARVSVRQVQHWTAVGLLHADERPDNRRRQGTWLTYAPEEVRVALVLASLVHGGVILSAAGPAARAAVVGLDENDPAAFATMVGGLAVFGRLP